MDRVLRVDWLRRGIWRGRVGDEGESLTVRRWELRPSGESRRKVPETVGGETLRAEALMLKLHNISDVAYGSLAVGSSII